MAARFCDKRNYVTTIENYGRQKMNLNIQLKKNDKSWILKALYGKHLLVFWNSYFKFVLKLLFSWRIKVILFSCWVSCHACWIFRKPNLEIEPDTRHTSLILYKRWLKNCPAGIHFHLGQATSLSGKGQEVGTDLQKMI